MRKILCWLWILIVLLTLWGCGTVPTEPVNKITYTIPGSIFPLINRQKIIEFYPDGTVRLSDCEMFDMENGTSAYLPGEAPVLQEYTFTIPKSYFSALEKEIYRANFFSLPEDLGVHRTDTAYTYLSVETSSKTHTCGGTDWPKEMDGIAKAIDDALNQAYFEDSREGDYTISDAAITHTLICYNLVEYEVVIWETTLKGDGTAVKSKYGPYPHPLAELDLDFDRDASLLISCYETEFDLALFNALLLQIQENGFLELPDVVPGMRDGVPIDLSDSNEKNYITVIIDDVSYTKSFIGAPSYYAPVSFVEVLDAFGEAQSSTAEEAPPTIEALLKWDF
jgi:hypothetical protein